MTPAPVTIRPETDPLAAVGLLKCGDFRHLPVTDAKGALIGLVNQSDLDVFLSKAESPGVIKRQHHVDQVMKRDVITVSPGCPLEEAASLMIENKTGCLPVVEDEIVVGIITETDIFKQFVSVLGGGSKSLRLTVQVPDVPGQLAELSSRIAQIGGNISSVVAYEADQPKYLNITLRVERADQETVLEAISSQTKLDVLHVWSGAET